MQEASKNEISKENLTSTGGLHDIIDESFVLKFGY